MNIKFIDTPVMLNLLEVPNRCTDAEEVKAQWKKNLAAKDVLIMPIATMIETGNHIAHIANGNKRRKIAGKFSEYLRKTAEGDSQGCYTCGQANTKKGKARKRLEKHEKRCCCIE